MSDPFSTIALEQADALAAFAAGPDDTGNGVYDGFNTLANLDLATAVNLDTSVPGVLRALHAGVGSPIPTTVNGPYTSATFCDRSVVLQNGQTVARIGCFSSTARAVPIKVLERTGTGIYAVRYNEVFWHPGGGKQMLTLATPYVVPASGTFHPAGYIASGNIETNVANRASASGDVTGTGITFAEAPGGNTIALFAEYASAGNLSVKSRPILTGGVPTTAMVKLFARLNDAVLNTDLTVSVTRDGSDYLQLPMAFAHYRLDGSAVYAGSADISGLHAGSTCGWWCRTLNGKSPDLLAVGVEFGVI